MARIVEQPVEKQQKCHRCTSLIAYTFYDVKETKSVDMCGDVEFYNSVNCPKCGNVMRVGRFGQ